MLRRKLAYSDCRGTAREPDHPLSFRYEKLHSSPASQSKREAQLQTTYPLRTPSGPPPDPLRTPSGPCRHSRALLCVSVRACVCVHMCAVRVCVRARACVCVCEGAVRSITSMLKHFALFS
eukprot:1105260-Prorocentrum_minimum.AAC.1